MDRLFALAALVAVCSCGDNLRPEVYLIDSAVDSPPPDAYPGDPSNWFEAYYYWSRGYCNFEWRCNPISTSTAFGHYCAEDVQDQNCEDLDWSRPAGTNCYTVLSAERVPFVKACEEDTRNLMDCSARKAPDSCFAAFGVQLLPGNSGSIVPAFTPYDMAW